MSPGRLLVLGALLTALLVAAIPATAQVSESGVVVEVIDGDSVKIDLGNGNVRTVRYLGIDAPENSAAGQECYGQEAWAMNTALVMHERVTLVKDVSEADSQGRLLRYVYKGSLHVNAELVRLGYAVAAPVSPDLAKSGDLAGAQGIALAANVGLWKYCGGANTRTYPTPMPIPPTPAPTATNTPGPYEGPLNPFDENENVSCEDFLDQEEAQAFYWLARDGREPWEDLDPFRLDGNGNGIACEDGA